MSLGILKMCQIRCARTLFVDLRLPETFVVTFMVEMFVLCGNKRSCICYFLEVCDKSKLLELSDDVFASVVPCNDSPMQTTDSVADPVVFENGDSVVDPVENGDSVDDPVMFENGNFVAIPVVFENGDSVADPVVFDNGDSVVDPAVFDNGDSVVDPAVFENGNSVAIPVVFDNGDSVVDPADNGDSVVDPAVFENGDSLIDKIASETDNSVGSNNILNDYINGDIRSTSNDVNELNDDVRSTSNDVNELNNDVRSTSNDVNELNKDVIITSNDVRSTSNDVNELKPHNESLNMCEKKDVCNSSSMTNDTEDNSGKLKISDLEIHVGDKQVEIFIWTFNAKRLPPVNGSWSDYNFILSWVNYHYDSSQMLKLVTRALFFVLVHYQ